MIIAIMTGAIKHEPFGLKMSKNALIKDFHIANNAMVNYLKVKKLQLSVRYLYYNYRLKKVIKKS